jgi:hypothetical protein
MEKINLNADEMGPKFENSDFENTDFNDFDPEDEVSDILHYPYKEKDFNYSEELLEDIPDSLVDTITLSKTLNKKQLSELYSWYSNAMIRRDREPLEVGRFMSHFFEEGSSELTVSYGDSRRGYLFGFYKEEIFIPTHFLPKTMKGGYGLFKELSERKDLPVATAITEDLADTLLKMRGWHDFKTKFLSYFSDSMHEKVLVYNSAKGMKRKLISLARELWEESKRIEEDEFKQY